MERFINSLPIGLDPYEVVGNPQLRPEANVQLDLLLQYKKDRTDVQLSPFLSWVDDYISTVVDPTLKPMIATSPGVRRYINIDRARLMGVELSAAHWFNDRFGNELTISYTHGTNMDRNEPLPEINPFDIRYTLKGQMLKGRLTPTATLRHTAAQNRVSEAFNERTTAAFTLVDLGLVLKVKDAWNLSCAVQNLFDVAYREHLSRYIRPTLPLNSMGRNVVIMAAYTF
jgi:iron complex outermembrane receptor protein